MCHPCAVPQRPEEGVKSPEVESQAFVSHLWAMETALFRNSNALKQRAISRALDLKTNHLLCGTW